MMFTYALLISLFVGIPETEPRSIITDILEQTESEIFSGITELFHPTGGYISFLPALNESTENWASRELKRLDNSFLPCDCKNYECQCCFKLDLSVFKIHHKLCLKISYDKNSQISHMSATYDEAEIYSLSIPLKNPSPKCLTFPYLQDVSVCMRFHNVSINQERAKACLDVEPFILDKTLFNTELNFKLSCVEFNWNEGLEIDPIHGNKIVLFKLN